MKRLVSFGAAAPLAAALATSSCGPSSASEPHVVTYTNVCGPTVTSNCYVPLSDFESTAGLLPPFPSNGWGFDGDASGAAFTPDVRVNGQVAMIADSIRDNGVVSKNAYHITCFGDYTGWGTVWYVDFASVSTDGYDISPYTGISFWLRSDKGVSTVKMGIADYYTFDKGNDPSTGLPLGACDGTDTKVGGIGCYDDYSTKIYVTQTWRRYDIPLATLTTGGWGYPHTFDTRHVYRLKFSMLPEVTYDIWMDDPYFWIR